MKTAVILLNDSWIEGMEAHGEVEGREDGQKDSALKTSGKATPSPDKNINIGQSCQTPD